MAYLDCVLHQGSNVTGEGLDTSVIHWAVYSRKQIEAEIGCTLDCAGPEELRRLDSLLEAFGWSRFDRWECPGKWFQNACVVRIGRTRILVTSRGGYDV